MKKIIFIIAFIHLSFSQVTTSCFEIESILVDACGTPEGENEMFRMLIGPSDLNVADLNITWASPNTFLGICQDATTATKVAELNATIENCGLLVEPTLGVLPANSTVIVITSTNFSTTANSFAGLSDTIYVIFQCAGNTGGHFPNATSSGLKNLQVSFGPTCNDNVTYNTASLVDINGFTGSGSPSEDRNGSSVNFNFSGTSSYFNNGCNAPVNMMDINAGSDFNVCNNDTLNLIGSSLGNFINYTWTGGNGSFMNNGTLNPSYIMSTNDVDSFYIYLIGETCNGNIVDSILIQTVSYEFDMPDIAICNGNPFNAEYTYSGSDPLIYAQWSNGEVAESIEINSPGQYYVIAHTTCTIDTAYFSVNLINLQASFTVDSIEGNSPLTVNFTNTSSAGAVEFNWDFNHQSSSSEINPTYTFIYTGENLVSLIATDGNCYDTAYTIIHVYPCDVKVFYPNAFTPNLDEVNPTWKIFHNCAIESELIIYDRWGNEVYSSTELHPTWNGLDNQNSVYPQGVYAFSYRYKDANKKEETIRGMITLLR